ncbi:MAG: winged helix-turn-helix domain-containing protein [Acidobacteria bacterium]|nr:winged helix-turn-helix domain-containing protein [Acidobacteriota bacterium]
MDILKLLVQSYPEWISRDEVGTKAWPADVHVSGHTVSANVSSLNKILGGEIDCAKNKGYRLKSCTEKAEKDYSFQDVWNGAGTVGKQVFEEFKANAILTFAGHSAIFANLVLVNYFGQDRRKLLEMPAYLGFQRDWPFSDTDKKPPTLPGYTPVPGEGVIILVPNALKTLAKRTPKPLRLAVIDDLIISAAVLAALRPYLQKVLGKETSIEFVCFLCYSPVIETLGGRKPQCAPVKSDTRDFTLPWGRPLWFGKTPV